MRRHRLILMFSVLVIALQGAGVLKTLHNLSHHGQASFSQSCDGSAGHQTTTKQAPKSPVDQPTDQPSDQDCQLCLTLHSLTPTLSDPMPLPIELPSVQERIAPPIAVMCTLYAPLDHPARGPPLS